MNVLARDGEKQDASKKAVTKWKASAKKDKVYPNKYAAEDETTGNSLTIEKEPEPPKKPLLRRILSCIPDKYMNNKALFLDVISRVFFPSTFIIFNVVFWAIYH